MKIYNYDINFKPDHWIKELGCRSNIDKDGMVSCSYGDCTHRFGAKGFRTLKEAKMERTNRIKDQISCLKRLLKEVKS